MAVHAPRIQVPHPHENRPRSSRWLALSVLCFSILIVNLDSTVLNVALPTLVRDLHATSHQLQWIVDAYALVYGGLLLIGGSLADRVGASARSWPVGGVRRRLGLGGVLRLGRRADRRPGEHGLRGRADHAVHPVDYHRHVQGPRGAAAGDRPLVGDERGGFALGPIMALLLARFWWGSVFLINVPIAAIALLCAIPLDPDSKNPAATGPTWPGAAVHHGTRARAVGAHRGTDHGWRQPW